jgi:hypothetical protein
LRNAINARRYSNAAPVPIAAIIPAAATKTSPSPSQAASKENNNQARKLMTPIRKAIETRVKNDVAMNKQQIMSAEKKTVAHLPSLKTPLRNAILARAKTFENRSQLEMSSPKKLAPLRAVDTVLSNTSRVGMRTPLRNAIHARRHSIANQPANTPAKPVADQVAEVVSVIQPSLTEQVIEPAPSKLKTPLKKAIESRRVSLVQSENLQSSQLSKPSEAVECRLSPIKKALKTPIREMIHARRQSVEPQRQSLSPLRAAALSPKRSDSKARSSLREAAALPRNEIRAMKTPLRKAIEIRRKSVAESFNISNAVVEAACIELAVEAYAQEVQFNESLSPADAKSKAVLTFQEDPSKFKSPSPIKTGGSMPSSAIQNEDENIELLPELGDAEVELIDIYAEKIDSFSEQPSIEEAYQLALSAYVRGIEAYYDDSIVHEQQSLCAIPRTDYSIDETYGKSLREMFKLPVDYMSAYDDGRDEELVEKYAMEMVECAGISIDIAYGIALDTFIADPVYFRHHIGGLQLPCADPTSNDEDGGIVVDEDIHLSAPIESSTAAVDNEAMPITNTPSKSAEAGAVPSTARRSSRLLKSAICDEAVPSVRKSLTPVTFQELAPETAKTPATSAKKPPVSIQRTARKSTLKKAEEVELVEPIASPVNIQEDIAEKSDLVNSESDEVDSSDIGPKSSTRSKRTRNLASETKAVEPSPIVSIQSPARKRTCQAVEPSSVIKAPEAVSLTPAVSISAEISSDVKPKSSRRKASATPAATTPSVTADLSMDKKKAGNRKRKVEEILPVPEEDEEEATVLLCDG